HRGTADLNDGTRTLSPTATSRPSTPGTFTCPPGARSHGCAMGSETFTTEASRATHGKGDTHECPLRHRRVHRRRPRRPDALRQPGDLRPRGVAGRHDR